MSKKITSAGSVARIMMNFGLHRLVLAELPDFRDPEFFQMLNMGAYQGQIEADWPEIAAGNGKKVPESLRLLQEMVEQYTDATGVAPEWR